MGKFIESRSPIRTQEELSSRNKLQMELLSMYINEGLVDEADTNKMIDIFRQVSDIIDYDATEHASILAAFRSGDVSAAAQMLKTIITI